MVIGRRSTHLLLVTARIALVLVMAEWGFAEDLNVGYRLKSNTFYIWNHSKPKRVFAIIIGNSFAYPKTLGLDGHPVSFDYSPITSLTLVGTDPADPSKRLEICKITPGAPLQPGNYKITCQYPWGFTRLSDKRECGAESADTSPWEDEALPEVEPPMGVQDRPGRPKR
jgi:hypothetical protein